NTHCSQLLQLLASCQVSAASPRCTLSLHDALPISSKRSAFRWWRRSQDATAAADQTTGRDRLGDCRQDGEGNTRHVGRTADPRLDRKSRRLNSSHVAISYAVFCLRKKADVLNRFIH